MWRPSANRRRWTDDVEAPMRVRPEILALCAQEIEPPPKAILRRLILPLIQRWLKIAVMGRGVHWARKARVRGARFGHYASFGHSAEFNGPVVVGDLTMLSSGVQVIGNDHGMRTPTRPMRLDFADKPRPVTVIEAECWVGSRVTIIEGVRIGRGSVIGSGALVTRDVPPYSVVHGVPARVVRQRFTPEEQAEHDRMLYGRAEAQGGWSAPGAPS